MQPRPAVAHESTTSSSCAADRGALRFGAGARSLQSLEGKPAVPLRIRASWRVFDTRRTALVRVRDDRPGVCAADVEAPGAAPGGEPALR